MKSEVRSSKDRACDPESAIARTLDWLDKAVIGLNLCPFAKAVRVKDSIRLFCSAARNEADLCADLTNELRLLVAADPQQIETTLLIHPHVLGEFLDYNEFLDQADRCLDELDLVGEIQIASFHPDYQFAGTAAQAIENHTNRSPFPMLHLLRERSIEQALATFPDAALIYERNIDTLRRLGPEGWRRLIDA
ncbi:MAG: DUF1415 domain-containing protein [Ideonella sp.]